MADLDGKVALVTGASRGLGEGVARALAARGAAMMLVARDGATAAEVAREIGAAGGRAEASACDVADDAAVERAVAETRERLRGLDILINNAGVIEPISDIATSDPAAWARNISVNLVGAYNAVRAALCAAALPLTRQRRAPPSGDRAGGGHERDADQETDG
jgi:NAD(P)-dependent dehydrogenase (short-subunit alcohol dehydrogenase family)